MSKLTPKQRRFVEEWKPWPADPRYTVARDGRIRGPSGRVLKGSGGGHGYRYVRGVGVHRIVLETYVGSGEGLDCNHINGRRDDNRLENLEWSTRSENMAHAFRVLGNEPVRGERNGRAKLSESDVAAIRAARRKGESTRSVARRFCISPGYVSLVSRGLYRGKAA